jgi:hypothetical protein
MPRETNGVAHSIAKLAISSRQNSMWLKDVPSHVSSLVLRDQVSP